MLLASVVLWHSEFPRLIMHCAKAFLLIKFMFCLLPCLMSLYPWTLRSARFSPLFLFFFFLHPSWASPSIYSNSSIVSALKEVSASFPVGFWDLWSLRAVPKASPPDLQATASSWEIQWAAAVRCALWSCSPELYYGRYKGALRHQHDYTVFFYLKNTGHRYCCSATWNCVSLLALLNFKNIFPCQPK